MELRGTLVIFDLFLVEVGEDPGITGARRVDWVWRQAKHFPGQSGFGRNEQFGFFKLCDRMPARSEVELQPAGSCSGVRGTADISGGSERR